MTLIPSEIISVLFIVIGIFFMFIGSLGVIRLPDFYSRTHAASKTDTLGILLVVVGMIVFEGASLNSVKLSFILIFIALANPIGSHALARAAMKTGLKPVLFRREQELTKQAQSNAAERSSSEMIRED